jgi:ribosome-associated heat shock protein Hsp15
MEKTRVDKWLWAVRIFKSRSMAADACKNGRVKLNGQILKPSFLVHKGDTLQVRKEHFNLVFKILEVIDKRVSAKLAEPCYENQTSSEELNKFKSWFLLGKPNEFRDKGTGRPTKKDRREIDEYKTDFVEDFEEFSEENIAESDEDPFNFDE